jgi:hypothetical protein
MLAIIGFSSTHSNRTGQGGFYQKGGGVRVGKRLEFPEVGKGMKKASQIIRFVRLLGQLAAITFSNGL